MNCSKTGIYIRLHSLPSPKNPGKGAALKPRFSYNEEWFFNAAYLHTIGKMVNYISYCNTANASVHAPLRFDSHINI